MAVLHCLSGTFLQGRVRGALIIHFAQKEMTRHVYILISWSAAKGLTAQKLGRSERRWVGGSVDYNCDLTGEDFNMQANDTLIIGTCWPSPVATQYDPNKWPCVGWEESRLFI